MTEPEHAKKSEMWSPEDGMQSHPSPSIGT